MRADGHGLKIQDEYFLTYPGVVSNEQLPREVNVYARLDDHARANPRTKKPKQGALQGRRKWPWGKEQHAFDDVPNGFDELGAPTVQPLPWIEKIVSDAGHLVRAGRLRQSLSGTMALAGRANRRRNGRPRV